jgi:hypothetical protein
MYVEKYLRSRPNTLLTDFDTIVWDNLNSDDYEFKE